MPIFILAFWAALGIFWFSYSLSLPQSIVASLYWTGKFDKWETNMCPTCLLSHLQAFLPSTSLISSTKLPWVGDLLQSVLSYSPWWLDSKIKGPWVPSSLPSIYQQALITRLGKYCWTFSKYHDPHSSMAQITWLSVLSTPVVLALTSPWSWSITSVETSIGHPFCGIQVKLSYKNFS